MNFYGILCATKNERAKVRRRNNMRYPSEPRSERNKAIVEELRKGAGVTAIASKYGITKQYASLLYNKYVNTNTELPRSKKAREVLEELIRGEMTHKQIAERLKVSSNTVSMIKRRYYGLISKKVISEMKATPDPTIQSEWKEQGYCAACGQSGIIRVYLQGRTNAFGMSLCKRCITLIHDEVLHRSMEWGVANAQ